jgi:hypothetical protein
MALEPHPPTPDELQRWAQQFRRFSAQDCSEDPLYVALAAAIADTPELLALLAVASEAQRRPVLLLAALHERILAGSAHELARYYPSAGGTRAPDAQLPALLADFARQQREPLLAHLRQRSTQTNEIGRSAVLWLALQAAAARSGRQDLALFDFGCSAGLNLGVDHYHYDYGAFQRGVPAGEGVARVRCEWRGTAPPPDGPQWRLVERMGVDLAPVDLQSDAALRWLQACVWPHNRVRAERLGQALAWARAARPSLVRSEDGLAVLEDWLTRLPLGVQPVLFNSWVLAYFEPAALRRHHERVGTLVRERGLLWINAEIAALAPLAAVPACPVGESPRSATLWTLSGPGGSEALAWSHPHGRWLQWGLSAR